MSPKELSWRQVGSPAGQGFLGTSRDSATEGYLLKYPQWGSEGRRVSERIMGVDFGTRTHRKLTKFCTWLYQQTRHPRRLKRALLLVGRKQAENVLQRYFFHNFLEVAQGRWEDGKMLRRAESGTRGHAPRGIVEIHGAGTAELLELPWLRVTPGHQEWRSRRLLFLLQRKSRSREAIPRTVGDQGILGFEPDPVMRCDLGRCDSIHLSELCVTAWWIVVVCKNGHNSLPSLLSLGFAL